MNPDNQHENTLRMLFGNTHAHNRCRIIGRSEQSCSQGGAKIKVVALGLESFSRTQNPIIEIYLGTLQPRNLFYLPIYFIAISQCNMM